MPSAARLGGAAPILPARDLDAAAAFYARLGFACVGPWDAYMILARDRAELHVFLADAAHDPAGSDRGVWIDCPDPDALVAEWATLGLPAAGIPRLVPPEDKPWGLREMALVDPEGTLLRLGRPVPD